MQVSDERLQEFQCIYKEEYGEEISLPQAREMVQRLLTLYTILKRPRPGDGAPASSRRSLAQSEPEAS